MKSGLYFALSTRWKDATFSLITVHGSAFSARFITSCVSSDPGITRNDRLMAAAIGVNEKALSDPFIMIVSDIERSMLHGNKIGL